MKAGTSIDVTKSPKEEAHKWGVDRGLYPLPAGGRVAFAYVLSAFEVGKLTFGPPFDTTLVA